MSDDYVHGVDDDGLEQLPPYVPLSSTRTYRSVVLALCTRCGAVVDGCTAGITMHDVWHADLDRRIEQARTAPPQVYGGKPTKVESDLFEGTTGTNTTDVPMEAENSITCPVCGSRSYSPNDIREGYCGQCHELRSMP